MRINTKFKLTVDADPNNPDRYIVACEVEGSRGDLVKIILEAMSGHELIHQVIDAATVIYHDGETITELKADQQIVTHVDTVTKVTKH